MKKPIRSIFLILFVILLPQEVLADRLKIVAFGDSLIAGANLPEDKRFHQQLRAVLYWEEGIDVDVINEGVPGDKTNGGRERLQRVLEQKPDVIIIELGYNDMFARVATDKIKENLDYIIRSAKESGVKILFAGMKADAAYGLKYSRDFNRIYPELADEHDVEFFPFFLEGVARRPSLNATDGIHPNQSGVTVIVRNIVPYIKNVLDDLD